MNARQRLAVNAPAHRTSKLNPSSRVGAHLRSVVYPLELYSVLSGVGSSFLFAHAPGKAESALVSALAAIDYIPEP
ncbi:MAG: hypothetical protein JWN13_2753 [Betaproteobacteria bacterium]|jgi:hypothetical protein|nr:hypothetical protein [Betaproteobacteria bacterium]